MQLQFDTDMVKVEYLWFTFHGSRSTLHKIFQEIGLTTLGLGVKSNILITNATDIDQIEGPSANRYIV